MKRIPTDILVKLLHRYSCPSFDTTQMLAYETDKQGNQHAATIHACCEMAAAEFDAIRIEDLKFRALVSGMKKLGLQKTYEFIMDEPIDKALL